MRKLFTESKVAMTSYEKILFLAMTVSTTISSYVVSLLAVDTGKLPRSMSLLLLVIGSFICYSVYRTLIGKGMAVEKAKFIVPFIPMRRWFGSSYSSTTKVDMLFDSWMRVHASALCTYFNKYHKTPEDIYTLFEAVEHRRTLTGDERAFLTWVVSKLHPMLLNYCNSSYSDDFTGLKEMIECHVELFQRSLYNTYDREDIPNVVRYHQAELENSMKEFYKAKKGETIISGVPGFRC